MQKVSVVIPLFRRELFDNLKSALKNQTYPIHELIAVEDKEGRGPCWGRNKGILEATGDWIAFIDDDCGKSRFSNWLQAFMKIGIGPFDRKSFSSNRYFLYYWIGEKTKAMGFFYEKCRTFWN